MSDYFDEMGWQPVEAEHVQRHQTLLVARFLMENGMFGEDFNAEQLAPPASKSLVRELPERYAAAGDERCAICLKPNDEPVAEEADETDGAAAAAAEGGADNSAPGAVFKVLPCSHAFHSRCILPWLEKTNSCPMCRHEMATDDAAYEEGKRHRARAVQREAELETLHDSMFG